MISNFVEFRHEVVVRRTQYELRKAEERAHILEGLIIASDNIDEVIKYNFTGWYHKKEFGVEELVEELKKYLEEKTKNTVRLNINEIRVPELVAKLVGESIAEQLERRVAFRRAVNTAMQRTMQVGAQGIKVVVSGRLSGADIARTEKYMQGRVPLHTLRAEIDYEISEANTTYGVIGIKVWIYKGDIIPTPENLLAIKTARIERNEQQNQSTQASSEG